MKTRIMRGYYRNGHIREWQVVNLCEEHKHIVSDGSWLSFYGDEFMGVASNLKMTPDDDTSTAEEHKG